MDSKEEIKKIIKESNCKTMKEFSEHYNIPYRTVQDWKLGNRTPPKSTIKLLKHILNVEKELYYYQKLQK